MTHLIFLKKNNCYLNIHTYIHTYIRTYIRTQARTHQRKHARTHEHTDAHRWRLYRADCKRARYKHTFVLSLKTSTKLGSVCTKKSVFWSTMSPDMCYLCLYRDNVDCFQYHVYIQTSLQHNAQVTCSMKYVWHIGFRLILPSFEYFLYIGETVLSILIPSTG